MSDDFSYHISLAITTFVITNIDDLLILSAYFASPRANVKQIVAGQFAGIAVLIIISLAGLLLNQVLDERYIRLLGLVPIFLGVRGLIPAFRGSNETSEAEEATRKFKPQRYFVSVMLVTIANGGDNIGVYAPLFATTEPYAIPLYVFIFMLFTGVLCLAGYALTAHPRMRIVFGKYNTFLLPLFLIALGLWILFGG